MDASPSGIDRFWSREPGDVLQALAATPAGLTESEAAERHRRLGTGRPGARRHFRLLGLFWERLRSPLLLILVFAAVVAAIVQDWLDAITVLFIVIVSTVISALQEYRASNAVERLRRSVAALASVLRDGQRRDIPTEQIVPGDVVLLSAGSLIPADGLLLEAKDLFVSESLLTGETFPVEKQPGIAPPAATMAQRTNCVFMGTSVRSGTGKALIVHTAGATEFGRISERLSLRPPETEFERGLRRFGALLMRIMILMVLAVLTVNLVLQRPPVDTLLFAIALAVGLSPELLPAILTVTLSRGAQKMAAGGVIVKRLNAIENLGSMDVLCTDKTGTLTRGVVQLDAALDAEGRPSEEVLRKAWLNSRLQTGLQNPLDQAVIALGGTKGLNDNGCRKLDEVPYDFIRKRLTIVIEESGGGALMITKGALQNVLEICDRVAGPEGEVRLESARLEGIQRRFADWSGKGFRVLGLATRSLPRQERYTRDDEQGFVFAGFLLFFDPPEPGVRQTLESLRHLGVQLKIVTGDNPLVARHVASAVGLDADRVLTGGELTGMKDEALWHLAPRISVFAEVEPNQKERIILALQKSGHVVGYLGDGINDAPALQAADAGISVDQAVDVAKEAADFILLKHDLDLIRQGIDEGRHTFANTLKYIFITSSANFGNMISMAAASLFLPFLPLLAKQILLNNFLSDIPAVGIAADNVDREWERTPHRWDIRMIRNFMISFGLVSTVFDLLTFGLLLAWVGDSPELFRTGWFVESLLTELAIVFVIRTYKPFYQSAPGRLLVWITIGITALTLVLPYLPLGGVFGLVPLPPSLMAAVITIVLGYLAASELTKSIFYRRLA